MGDRVAGATPCLILAVVTSLSIGVHLCFVSRMSGGVHVPCFVSYLTLLASVIADSASIYIGWEKEHLSVRLMQGMQVS